MPRHTIPFLENHGVLAPFLTACLAMGLVGCGEEGADGGTAERVDADVSDIDGAVPIVDAGVAADALPAVAAVPVDSTELFAYLQAGSYLGFVAEPAVHASAGPHSQVRSFFNPILADSLAANNSEHPIGAASVKELHNGQGLLGWAVTVKTQAGAAANSWYF